MSEKLEESVGKEIPEGQPSWTPAEERALADGWNPNADEMENPDDWVDAKTFNVKGELMARISQQGKQLGSQKDELETLRKIVKSNNEMTRRIVEKTYQKAMKELKVEKMEATRDGDVERVMELDDEMDGIKQQYEEANVAEEITPEAVQNQPDYANLTPQQRAWVDYVATTPWVQAPETYQGALAHADRVLNNDPNMSVGDFVQELNDYGKRVQAQSRPSPAGPGQTSTASRSKAQSRRGKFSASDLDDMQTSIGREFVEMGDFKSLDDYAEALGKAGAL
jgi:hypothetical protein